MKKESWTKEEENFLIKNYQAKGGKFVSEKLGRTIAALKGKAKQIGLITYTCRKWTDEEIVFLKENFPNHGCKFVCEQLNRNRGSVQKKASDFKLKVNYSPTFSKEELEEAVKNSYCFSNLIDNLGKTKTGAYLRIVKKYILFYQINISHFDPYKKIKENLLKTTKKFPIEYWLKYNSSIGSSDLKLKLYNAGLKERKCEKCNQGELWLGEKISLILDHIDGNNKNNVLDNLRILCPNCNAALPTHCRGYKKVKNPPGRSV